MVNKDAYIKEFDEKCWNFKEKTSWCPFKHKYPRATNWKLPILITPALSVTSLLLFALSPWYWVNCFHERGQNFDKDLERGEKVWRCSE